jgi:short-subunit dehydrogenase
MKKKIFITGAGSGFGKIAAISLAQQGHTVIATAQTGPQVQALRQEAKAKNIQLTVQKLELLNDLDRDKAWEHDIDILLNIAGICEAGPLAEQPMDLIRTMFDVNVFYNLELTQGFIPQMIKKGQGKILFMSSMSGLVGFPMAGAYCATKHAIEAIAEALQVELAPFGIKVATINPGPFKTGFNESGIDSIYQWYDPEKNFTPEKAIKEVEAALADQFNPEDIRELIIQLVESDNHSFRNIWPVQLKKDVEKKQREAWDMKS